MTRRRVLTWDRAVQRFLVEARVERGLTRQTLETYGQVLALWGDAIASVWGVPTGEIDPTGVDRDDLLDALASWTGIANSTFAQRISIARSFFDWLSEREGGDNPAARLRRPKLGQPLVRRISMLDAEALLAAPARELDRLVVWILFFTGIRRSELLGLRWQHVDLPDRVLQVLGKGNKARGVPIPVPLAEFLADAKARLAEHGYADATHYVISRRRELPGGVERILPHRPAEPGLPNRALARVATAAGVVDPDHVGPHVLRRAYATAFQHANPGDLIRLQAALGHANLSTTRRYVADAEQREIRDAADRAFGDFVTRTKRSPRRVEALPAKSENPGGVGEETPVPQEAPSQHDRSERPDDFVTGEEES